MEEKNIKGHVLIVEDEQMHRALMTEILLSIGLEVTVADNGMTALDKLDLGHNAIDLIILDWEMPEMDGLETIRKIRELQVSGGWEHMPVLAFTCNKREGDKEKCLAAGMDDYLSKEIWLPKWREKLLEKLEGWLSIENEKFPAKTAS